MSTARAVKVPEPLAASCAGAFGAEGGAWIAALPALAADLLERRQLKRDGETGAGKASLVSTASSSTTRCAGRAGTVAVRDRLRQRAGGKGGPLTRPKPTDRGRPGSKIHPVADRDGVPLSLGTSGADLHGSLGLEPLARGIPLTRSRRGSSRRRPAKLPAGKGYDCDHLRK